MNYDGSIRIDTLLATKGFNASLNKISASVKKLAATVGIAFGVSGLIKFGKEAINLSSDIQEVQNVVDVAFGSMSNMVKDFAATSIEKFGMSELSAKRTASTYMAMSKGMGLYGKEAAQMAIDAAARTGDIASFYNMKQEEADTLLKSIWTGETESLKRIGVVMTETNLQQYALEKGIRKSISAMNQQEKTLLRYAFVMEKTSLAAGDFERTQDSWANQTRILQENFKQLLSILGTGLIQMLTPALQILNRLIARLIEFAKKFQYVTAVLFGKQTLPDKSASAMEDAAAAQNDYAKATKNAENAQKGFLSGLDEITTLSDKNASEGIDPSIAALMPKNSESSVMQDAVEVEVTPGMQKVIEFFQKLGDRIQKTNKWIKEHKTLVTVLAVVFASIAAAILLVVAAIGIYNTITTIATAVQTAFGVSLAVSIGWLALIVAAIAAVIAIIALCIIYWDDIKEAGVKAWKKIKEWWGLAKTWFNDNVVTPVKKFFSGMWDSITEKGENAWNKTTEWWSFAKTWFNDHVTTPVKEFFSGMWDSIAEKGENAWDKIKGFAVDSVNAMTSAVEGFVNFFIKGINLLIGGLNKINIDIPDWIPNIGGKSFGFSISAIPEISLPRLAKGAVIPPNAEFAAVLGDQRHGRNLEAPEGLIRQIVREESGTNLTVILQMPNGSQKKAFDMKSISRANRQSGKVLIPVEV